MDTVHMECEAAGTGEPVSIDMLFKPENYQKALRVAEKLARLTNGGLEPVDMVQEALRILIQRYQGRYDQIREFEGLLVDTVIVDVYTEWVRRKKDLYLNLTSYDRYTGWGSEVDDYTPSMPQELHVYPDIDQRMLERDMERAISQLDPDEQAFVRQYLQTDGAGRVGDLSLRELASQLGIHRETVRLQWHRIRPKLAALLADYRPHDERTSHEKAA